MTSKGCWTCKGTVILNQRIPMHLHLPGHIERKIHCDRTQPSCQKCTQSNRTCLGYGLRLSWPKSNKSKRMLLGPRVWGSTHTPNGRLMLLNTAVWDMEVHRHLSSSIGVEGELNICSKSLMLLLPFN
jgi:hypothetical protein